jgi:hypothetical protein
MHLQLIAEPRRRPIVGVAGTHRQDDAVLVAKLGLIDAGGVENFAARPFRVFQIVGVIDDAGAIGVFPIDA